MQLRKESLKKSGNCISCVNNCEDLLYIYFFIPQFKYMSFIYSQFQIILCWTKFIDISCQSSCQTNYLVLDQINGYQLSLIMSKKLSYVGPNSWISAVNHNVEPIILCWTKFMDISCQSSRLVLDQINGYQLSLITSNQLPYVGPN